jgi:hypothetical protein
MPPGEGSEELPKRSSSGAAAGRGATAYQSGPVSIPWRRRRQSFHPTGRLVPKAAQAAPTMANHAVAEMYCPRARRPQRHKEGHLLVLSIRQERQFGGGRSSAVLGALAWRRHRPRPLCGAGRARRGRPATRRAGAPDRQAPAAAAPRPAVRPARAWPSGAQSFWHPARQPPSSVAPPPSTAPAAEIHAQQSGDGHGGAAPPIARAIAISSAFLAPMPHSCAGRPCACLAGTFAQRQ